MTPLHCHIGGVEITFRFWFFVVAALFVILVDQTLAVYAILPIVIHEAGHLLALKLCGIQIRGIVFTPVSVELVRRGGTASLSKEMCVGIAGIAANLLAAALLYSFTFPSMRNMLLIVTNLAVAIFNLLPIGSLDGGTVVRLLCEWAFFPFAARVISRIVSMFALAPLFGVSIWMIWSRSGNFTLLLCCIYLAITVILRD